MKAKANLFRRRILVTAISVLLALVVAMPIASGQSPGTNQSTTASNTNADQDQDIKIMTYNLYLGADLAAVATAAASGNQTRLIQAVTSTWSNVVATNFPERADALANEIDQSQPELINLQEVSRYSTADYPNTPTDLTANTVDDPDQLPNDVKYNYLRILLDALKNRGLNYTPVVINKNYDPPPLPGFTSPGKLQNIRLIDRDVILARADLPVSNTQKANFLKNLSFPIKDQNGNTIQTVPLTRGWASADVMVGGKTFRLIDTHLERDDPNINIEQGNEILQGPAKTDLPVILAGDLNSRPDDNASPTTYKNLIEADFADAWSATHRNSKQLGNTCCHATNLRDTAALSQRTDLVLLHGSLSAFDAKVIGEKLSDRTSSGLWPSDHAGVVVTLGGQHDQGEQ